MMSAQIGSAARTKLVQVLTAGLAAASGGPASLAVVVQNVAADIAEKSAGAQYPAAVVYCEKVSNQLQEKFRSFSGTVELAIEIRHSQDRLEGVEDALEQITDIVTGILSASRGDWGNGMFYSGAYDVSYGSVKRGGRNFLQTAKVRCELSVSVS
jgi:hypothetical protein